MSEFHGHHNPDNPQEAYFVGLMNACWYRTEDLRKPCDGMAHGFGIHYVLPERKLIAGSIEAMSNACEFDGMVFICSCDKIVPGMLMAAAAVNKPSIFITPGTVIPYESGEHLPFVRGVFDVRDCVHNGSLLRSYRHDTN